MFIHGFNVKFEDAVYRTAQMAYNPHSTALRFSIAGPR